MTGERDRFTAEEWRTLQLAPFWMFSAVVGAYDRFDPRDFGVFVRCMEAASLTGGGLRRELLASVVADPDRLAAQFRQFAADVDRDASREQGPSGGWRRASRRCAAPTPGCSTPTRPR